MQLFTFFGIIYFESSECMKYSFDKRTKVLIILLSMFIGAVFGYIYEVIFYKIDTGHFINRGTTFGPWIPIYAYGALLIYLTTSKIKDKPMYVFLISTLVCGILEYTIGYLLYRISGTRLWDYNTEILNFGNINGFVCLRSVLFFGLSGLLLMYLVVPTIEKLALNISKKKFSIISIGSFSIFYADTIYNHIIAKIINYIK